MTGPSATEAAFQRGVFEDVAARYGWRWWHNPDSRRTRAGWPDAVYLGFGRALFVEHKSAIGRVSREQASVLDELEAAGLEVGLWRPSDVPLIVKVLGPAQQRLGPWRDALTRSG